VFADSVGDLDAAEAELDEPTRLVDMPELNGEEES
jgi:hypothetical protein